MDTRVLNIYLYKILRLITYQLTPTQHYSRGATLDSSCIISRSSQISGGGVHHLKLFVLSSQRSFSTILFVRIVICQKFHTNRSEERHKSLHKWIILRSYFRDPRQLNRNPITTFFNHTSSKIVVLIYTSLKTSRFQLNRVSFVKILHQN